MRYFIEVSYNGQAYHGWQIQQNAHTVQAEINAALAKLSGRSLDTVGSGRTDTGVHARQQFLHVDVPQPLEIPETVKKLNAILPMDIAVLNIFEVQPQAHARFDAISRSYEYHITRLKDPFLRDLSYYFTRELRVDRMNKACKLLLRQKDFRCFSKVKTAVNNFECDIITAEWSSDNELYVFYVSANRFLRGMVRAMVGTLMEVGLNKLSLKEFQIILDSGDRRKAGMSVPPQGLFLTKILYPDQLIL